MGLKPGVKVAIWSIDDKGNYAKASLSTTAKDKEGHYFTDWSNKFVSLVGNAYEAVKGISINEDEKEHIDAHIGWGFDREIEGKKFKQPPFEITNNYDKAKKVLYTNYTIFDLEVKKESKSASSDSSETPAPKKEPAPSQQETSSGGLVGLDFLNIPDTNALADLPFK